MPSTPPPAPPTSNLSSPQPSPPPPPPPPPPLPILIIGAGIAGLVLAQGLRHQHPSIPLRIFERQPRSSSSSGHRFRLSSSSDENGSRGGGGYQALLSVLPPRLRTLVSDTEPTPHPFAPRYVDPRRKREKEKILEYPAPTTVATSSSSKPVDRTQIRRILGLGLGWSGGEKEKGDEDKDVIEYGKEFVGYEIISSSTGDEQNEGKGKGKGKGGGRDIVEVTFGDGTKARGQLLVGADGVRSRVRKQVQGQRWRGRLLDLERWVLWGRTYYYSGEREGEEEEKVGGNGEGRKGRRRELRRELRAAFLREEGGKVQEEEEGEEEVGTEEDILSWCMYRDEEANVQAVVEPMVWGPGARELGVRQGVLDDDEKGGGDYVYWVLCTAAGEFAERIPTTAEERRDFSLQATRGWHPALRRLFELAAHDLSACAPVLSSKPDIKMDSCQERSTTGLVTLVGDAAHAMSPMGGSGADTAVKNAAALSNIIAEKGVTRESLAEFEAVMSERAKERIEHSFRGGKTFWKGKEWSEYKEAGI